MIAQWQIEQFHQQGYLVVEGVLSAADIATLQSDFDGWVEESRRHASAWGETLDGRPRFDIERDHAPDHLSLRRVASPTEISEAYRHTALNSRMATIAAAADQLAEGRAILLDARIKALANKQERTFTKKQVMSNLK